MKKLNKLFLAAGSVAAIAAPVAAVVSCGTTESNGTINVKIVEQRTAVASTEAAISQANADVYLALDGHDHSAKDKSFNESALNAIKAYKTSFADDHILTPAADDEASFVTNYKAGIGANKIIVAPGFSHISPLSTEKNARAILLDGDVARANIASVEFNTHQAAFLAGVAAGEYLNTRKDVFAKDGSLKVGAFGGLAFDTVTSFMAGFQGGIDYFNAHLENGQQKVEFIDLGGKNDYFSGGFGAGGGTVISQKLINAGADLILPVAGQQTLDVLKEAAKVSGRTVEVIGVDSVQEKAVNDSHLLFSITKNIEKATTMELEAIAGATNADTNAGFGKLLIGDLKNELVGISDGSGNPANTDATRAKAIKDAYDKVTAKAGAIYTAAEAFKPVFNY